jgi:molybdopterin-guanine dinucleotide biosynthesis protein A
MTTAAIILAGGGAVRLGGGDKPLLCLAGTTMLARIIATLRADIADIAISANGDPARFAAFGLPVLSDGARADGARADGVRAEGVRAEGAPAGEGPLAGILTGLDWAAARGATALLSVPGDTPFIPSGLAVALSPAPACAAGGGRTHHLVALWPIACRDALHAWLTRPGPRAVARFADHIGMRRVDFPPMAWDSFLNVNTADDLAAARRVASGFGHGRSR